MCVKVLLYALSALPACSSLKISAQVERNELDPVADDVTLSTLNCSNRFTAGCWKKGGHSVGKKSKTESKGMCQFNSEQEIMEHLEMLGYCIEYMFMAGLYKEECMEGAEPDAAAILYFPMPPFPCVSDAKIADIEVAPKVAFDPFDLMPAQKEIVPFPPKLMPFPELEPFPPKLMPFPKMPFPKKKMEIFSGFTAGVVYPSVYVSIMGDSCFGIAEEQGMIDCFDGSLENRYTMPEGPLEKTADLQIMGDFFEPDWYGMPSDFSIPGFPGLFECAAPSIPFEKIMDDSLQYTPLKFKETKRKERGGGGGSVMFIAKGMEEIMLPRFCSKPKKIPMEFNPFEIMYR
jgi:hypothetical protein